MRYGRDLIREAMPPKRFIVATLQADVLFSVSIGSPPPPIADIHTTGQSKPEMFSDDL